MAERLKATVLKTVVPERVSEVRILSLPPKLKIGIGSRNGVAPQARHKRIPAKNSRIQKVFPRSAWLKKDGSILNLKVRTDFFVQMKFFFIYSLQFLFRRGVWGEPAKNGKENFWFWFRRFIKLLFCRLILQLNIEPKTQERDIMISVDKFSYTMAKTATNNNFINPDTGRISITESFRENLAMLLVEKI